MEPIIKKLIEKGDKTVNSLINELMTNKMFANAIEKIIVTKGIIDRKVKLILNTMNFATKFDVDELADEIRQIKRKIRNIERTLKEINDKLNEKSQ